MLPSSHLVPINVLLGDRVNDSPSPTEHEPLANDQISAPPENLVEESDVQATSALLLAGEFSQFIAAASRLEKSYRALQVEVSELGVELSERNAALNTSLAENKQMWLSLQQIVDSMPCGVLVLDRNKEVSMINPECRRLLGLDMDKSFVGSATTLLDFSTYCGINLESPYHGTSESDAEQEFCVRDSSGKRWLEVRNRQLFHQASRPCVADQTILILRDVTAQKRSERDREAGRKAMALAEITTILAHEIRNPLASLELFAELIEEDGERRSEWISNLRAGIRTLSGTANNVLSFHGSGSLTLVPLPLSALIGHALQFVQPLADQAGVSLEWPVDNDAALVMGNESALRQVVLNLVSNAIRHTPAGGTVGVFIRCQQTSEEGESDALQVGHVIAEFCDTGCGIRPDQIAHIFEPGFSGTGDTSGLGLAVCERIMKQHGGSISASNGIRSGARFSLHFPVVKRQLATA